MLLCVLLWGMGESGEFKCAGVEVEEGTRRRRRREVDVLESRVPLSSSSLKKQRNEERLMSRSVQFPCDN